MSAPTDVGNQTGNTRTHWWSFTIPWLIALPGTAWLAAELAREYLVSGYSNGPGIVGYGVMHSSLGPFVVLSTAVLGGSTLIVAAVTAVCFVRKKKAPTLVPRQILVGAVLFALVCVPPTAWRMFLLATVGPGTHGEAWLFDAAADNDVLSARILRSRGVALDVRDRSRDTPLIIASQSGALSMVRYLLDHGANAQAIDSFGTTAPIAAAGGGQRKVFEELLERHGRLPCKDTASIAPDPSMGRLSWQASEALRRMAKLADSTIDVWAREDGVVRPIC